MLKKAQISLISRSHSTNQNYNCKSIFFFAASSPVLVNPPKDLMAWDGKDATIPCKAEGAPAPNVTWFFNGKFYLKKSVYCTDEF